ncbi:2-dehydropantoate 2-reductase [Pseudonocardia spinosispora]|uniref:2-dehydropantoate 2-reductase n=1 Tax=Pseudonocardia spinosispora TaxID=103441 RepID=UPI000405844F|nr:2-dehydropantoate 2-reductase [Pseudonocardia spinosispora]
MRILVVGAGATGGFFGGRLAQAGRDVTFLVRERRAQQLRRDGLVIVSPNGDVTLTPKLVTGDELGADYDLVFFTVKSYGLDQAIADIAPAVGPETMILPVLNGMRHLDVLVERFGEHRVLGGLCAISGTLDADGTIRQLAQQPQHVAYGDRKDPRSARLQAVHEQFSDAGFPTTLPPDIIQSMWQKWVFLSSMATITCLMRGPIGQVVAAPGGTQFAESVVAECAAIATANGHPMPADELDRTLTTVTTPGSTFAASMFRDLSQGYPIEADHIIGDLLARAEAHDVPAPLVRLAYTHLSVYQQSLAR